MVIFPISPIISITLMSLYIALTLPLPFLVQLSHAPVPLGLFIIGIVVGGILLYGVLSERVILYEEKIQVTYPFWIPKFLRPGWSLPFGEIQALKMRTTGQGGLVYYFTCKSSAEAYLLPMRVVGFSRMVTLIQEKTGIDTTDVRPLAQPWMYLALLVCTLLLLLVDFWTIFTALGTVITT